MADRQVTQTGKDSDGDITKLCNPEAWWSPRSKDEAIEDIDSETHTYYVLSSGGVRTEIRVVDGENGPYLRTDPDTTADNNLADLPDC